MIELLLSKGGQPHVVAVSQEEDFCGKWDERSPLDIAENEDIIQLLQNKNYKEMIYDICDEIFTKDIEQVNPLSEKEEKELEQEKREHLFSELEKKLAHEEKNDDIPSHFQYDIIDVDHYNHYYDPGSITLERMTKLKKYGYDPNLIYEITDNGIGVVNLETSHQETQIKSSGDQFTNNEDKSSDLEAIVNWNERFQIGIFTELIHLEKDFLHCAETYGKIIISEYYLDKNQKTIKPSEDFGGVAGFNY